MSLRTILPKEESSFIPSRGVACYARNSCKGVVLRKIRLENLLLFPSRGVACYARNSCKGVVLRKTGAYDVLFLGMSNK